MQVAYAAQSDPAMNPQFRRRWTDPPDKRKRGPTTSRAPENINNSDAPADTPSRPALQAAALDRAADFALQQGYHRTAEYPARPARGLREAT